ncbi:hypothetical protein OAF71_00760 [bacterium]|nr:hypothetical protein [bacterium]
MKPFIIKTVAFLALQLCFLLVICRMGNPEISHTSYYHAMYDKLDYLESLQGNRLIMVGGSSVAFGVDSKKVARNLNWKPVNFGLHAATGLDFYLSLLRRNVRAGDLVLLLPEYEMLIGREGAETKFELMQACPQFAADLCSSWKSRKSLLDRDALHLLHESMVRAFDPNPPVHHGIYSRHGFNEQGDMIAHHGVCNEQIVKSSFLALASEDLKQANETIRSLNDFAEFCRSQGVKLLISYPPITQSRFDGSRDFLEDLHQLLVNQLDVDILNRPEDSIFQEGQFFDTYYHLTEEAKWKRSTRLNLALHQYLAGTSRVAHRKPGLIE